MATYYVDTDGTSQTYSTIAGAISQIITDYSGVLTEAVIIECAATDGDADEASVSTSGITTDSTNTLTIQAASGHEAGPEWDESKYRIAPTSGNAIYVNNTEHCIVIGIQAYSDGGRCFYTSRTGGNYFYNCYAKGSGSSAGYGFYMNGCDFVYDNVVYNCIATDCLYGLCAVNWRVTIYARNNTVVNCGTGYGDISGNNVMYVGNCIGVGCSTADFSIASTRTEGGNISSDATSPDASGQSQTVEWNFPGIYVPLKGDISDDFGTDFSSAITTDMVGQDRTSIGWDAGAVCAEWYSDYNVGDNQDYTSTGAAESAIISDSGGDLATIGGARIVMYDLTQTNMNIMNPAGSTAWARLYVQGDPTNYHGGVFGAGVQVTYQGWGYTRYVLKYVTISGFEIVSDNQNSGNFYSLRIPSGGNCRALVYDMLCSATQDAIDAGATINGILLGDYKTNDTLIAYNCICDGCNGTGFIGTTQDVYFYNCTAVNCTQGFSGGSNYSVLINCLGVDNTTNFSTYHKSGTTANVSNDSSIPSTGTNYASQTVTLDANYAPAESGPCDGVGEDMDIFSTDISGVAQTTDAWDVGAWVCVTASGSTYQLKAYSSSTWVDGTLWVYNDSAWEEATLWWYDGADWVQVQ